MPNLTRYVHYACGFVDFEGKSENDLPSLYESFIKFCDSYHKITKYYLIGHTETNILHIHYVFYSQSQVQLMTYFNKMRSWFVDRYQLVHGEGGISIAKCESINSYLKYCTHTDKESVALKKKEYSIDDFVSNDDIEIIDSLIHSKKGTIDAYMLRDAVLDCPHEFDLMTKLGLNVYHRYRYEIKILQENRIYLASEREKEKQQKIEDLDTPF